MRAFQITHNITRRDEKSLEKYFTDISQYDVLTPEQELNLFNEYRSGKEGALDKIVFHNLRFVISVAKKYQNLGLTLGDLINEGNIGLIKAAERFDETKGFKFISYAVWWIRQSILQAINEKGKEIRVPQNHATLYSKIQAERDRIMQTEERVPTVEELAAATEVSTDLVKKCLSSQRRCSSLDAPITEDADDSLGTLLVDQEADAPDTELALHESQRQEVAMLLDMLNEQQQKVLIMYFGIGQKHPWTLESIGDHMGISRERVRQIKDSSLRILRKRNIDIEPTFSEN